MFFHYDTLIWHPNKDILNIFFKNLKKKKKKLKIFFGKNFFSENFRFFFSENFFFGSIMKVFREEFFRKIVCKILLFEN